MQITCFQVIGKLLLTIIISASAISQAEPVATTQKFGLHILNKHETDFYSKNFTTNLQNLKQSYATKKRDLRRHHTQEIIASYSHKWIANASQDARSFEKQMGSELSDRIAADYKILNSSLQKNTLKLQKTYEQVNSEIKTQQKKKVNALKERQNKENNELKEQHQAEQHRMQEQQSIEFENLTQLFKDAERNYNKRKEGLEREILHKLAKRHSTYVRSSRNILKTSHSSQKDVLKNKHAIERRLLKIKHNVEWHGGIGNESMSVVKSGFISERAGKQDASSVANGVQTLGGVDQTSQLKINILSARNTIPTESPYLYDTDSFKGAVSTVWTDLSHKVLGQRNPREVYEEFFSSASEYRNLADLELIYAERLMAQGKLDSAQQHVEKSKNFAKLSNLSNDASTQVFNNGVESATILAKGIYEGSKAALIYPGKAGLLPPGAVNVIDGLFTTLDYAVDVSDVGQADANKSLIKDIAIKALISAVPVESLGGKTISDSIANGTGKIVGQSGIYELLGEVTQSQQAKELIMAALANSSAGIVNEGAKAVANEAWGTTEGIVDQVLSDMRSGLYSSKNIN